MDNVFMEKLPIPHIIILNVIFILFNRKESLLMFSMKYTQILL